MLKKTITYMDFNGEEVVEDFYFHLSKAELIELEMSHDGGLQAWLTNLIAARDGKTIMAEFKNIILNSYGQRSEDGRRFVKTQALREEFESTEAYSALFVELVTDTDAAIAFARGIIPQDLAEEAARVAEQTEAPAELTEAPAPVAETEVDTLTRHELQEMDPSAFEKAMLRVSRGELTIVD